MNKPTQQQIYAKLNSDLSWLNRSTLYLTMHGSHAYGLNNEHSDIDIRGIAIPPSQYFYGFQSVFEQLVASDPYDIQTFGLIKFFKLTAAGNPNTIELLFTEPEDHILITSLGQKLLDNRDLFLSRNLKERYVGYAKAQAHRTQNHRRWLLGGELKPPVSREEFGLKPELAIDKDQFLRSSPSPKETGWVELRFCTLLRAANYLPPKQGE